MGIHHLTAVEVLGTIEGQGRNLGSSALALAVGKRIVKLKPNNVFIVHWKTAFSFHSISALTLNESLSAIDISTCGVRKCIGGVPFSLDRIESCNIGAKSNEFDERERNFGHCQ